MEQSANVPAGWSVVLPDLTREVEDFLADTGWDQPPQLFALVPTAALLAAEPALAERIPPNDGLTPVAQEPLPADDVPSALAGICWPELVVGCALAQEIIVLPPEAEDELDAAVVEAAGPDPDDAEVNTLAVRTAMAHPQRREARLVVAVLRDGGYSCVLRIRGVGDDPDELVEHPDLAPNMVDALAHTMLPADV